MLAIVKLKGTDGTL